MKVYVLLYNAGTDNEGIHSLSIGDDNIILMFEDEDDAQRYAMLLEAQDFQAPAVEAIDREEVEAFCQDSPYQPQLIPRDFRPSNDFERLLLAPPELNREETDWSEDGRPADVVDAEADSLPASDLEALRRRLEGLL